MEGTFKPPKSLVFNQDVHVNLDNFLRSLDIYMRATGLEGKDGSIKVAILLNLAGEEAQKKFQTFRLTEAERSNFDSVVKAFKDYCKPMRNETYDRYKFFTRTQQEGESFSNFVTDIKLLASVCNFAALEDSLVRDRLVSGILDLSLQERLLQQSALTLEKAEDICRASEISKIQVKDLHNDKEVDFIKQSWRNKSNQKQSGQSRSQAQESGNSNYDCLKCGRRHPAGNCPAFGKMCSICNKLNHFAIGCKNKNSRKQVSEKYYDKSKNVKKIQKKTVHECNTNDDALSDDDSDSLYIDTITLDHISTKKSLSKSWTIDIVINSKTLIFKLDTGASCNVLPLNIYNKLGFKNIRVDSEHTSIITYGNNKIDATGTVILDCYVKGVKCKIRFLLVDVDSAPILGLNACMKLNLLKRVDFVGCGFTSKSIFINRNKDVFSGTGKVPFKYKIVLKSSPTPFVSACRRIPDSVKPALKNTLDDLINRDIIKQVNEPTEWVNNIVLVEKHDKKIRICLDPVHLNQNICTDQYPIPTVEELALKLKGKSMFTVLDLKEGFYHVPLDKESMKLCTFITPFGKYCFKRLPFGLNVSPEVFQRVNEKMFGDLDIGIYFDDFIIATETEVEHDKILNEVLARARKYGVKFNDKKVQFKVKEVKYVGQIFSVDGVKPDPQYIEALLSIEIPKSKKELLRIMGMVNYLTKYLPKLSEFLAPLRKLIKNNIPWVWTIDHTLALNTIKKLLTEIPNLKIFDPKSPIEIQSDASQFGVGGCLLQNGNPVAFCSRSLTEAEVRYPQIDKELLGICFALKKFHNFIYGRKILVKTDHKPLVAICTKDFYKVSNRLQKLKLMLLKYDFTIEYLPGKHMYIADLLSRSFIRTKQKDESNIKFVHCVDLDIPISTNSLENLKKESESDPVLSTVRNFCMLGWPENLKKLEHDQELSAFFKIRNDLVVKNFLVFYNDKIIVPKTLRNAMLVKLHNIAHLGAEKCKARARKIFYWPGLSTDINNFIAKCKICQKFSRKPTKEKLVQHDRPNFPYYKVAADILTYGGCDYLVVVDYFSLWIDLVKLDSKTAEEIINKLKTIFSVHGIPIIFVSDNMPFNSVEFRQFARKWDFDIITSSPKYPKSNGLAERSVGICKTILRKCSEADGDVDKALLEYRTTPLVGINLSPSELLNQRLLRTTLPVLGNLLLNKPEIDFEKMNAHRNKAITYYDRQAVTRPSFKKGDSVILRKEKHWVPGEIIGNSEYPRSYFVKDNFGKVYRRNSSFIKSSPNPYMQEHSQFEQFDESNKYVEPEPDVMPPSTDTSISFSNSPGPSNVTNVRDTFVKTRAGRVVKKPIRYRE